MTITLSPDLAQFASATQTANNPLDLKLNQVLDAKVIDTQALSNSFTLQAEGKTLLVQSQQAINLQTGQSLQLQVVQLQPAPEFNLIALTAPEGDNQTSARFAVTPLLKLIGFQLQTPANPLTNTAVKPMDINLPLNLNQLTTAAQSPTNLLDLKLNQIVDAKVIETQAIQNSISLSITGKTVQVQPQQPLNLQPGQSLQLQVVKLLPALEFKIVQAAVQPASNPTLPQSADPQILKLLGPQAQAQTTAPANITLNQLPKGQTLQATVISIAENKITLQLLPAAAATITASAPVNLKTLTSNQLVTLDAKQLILPDTENAGTTAVNKQPPAAFSALAVGTQITLQVVNTGKMPSFAVTLPNNPAGISEQKINDLLKQLLPIQSSPAFLLNFLSQILPVLENSPNIAESLKQLALQILASIPAQAQLGEPALLKQNIAQSGLFLESKLAELLLTSKTDVNLQDDLKFRLLKLAQSLSSAISAQSAGNVNKDNLELLKEILKKADSTLAKLTLDQFNSLPNDESPKQGWILELPFFQQQLADTVKIEIQQDKNSDNERNEKNWAVSITITPPELATIHCRISCYDGAVNTRFWSDAASTVELINSHLDHLKQQFEQKGLKTGFMEAQQGKPAQSNSVNKPIRNLLSEKV